MNNSRTLGAGTRSDYAADPAEMLPHTLYYLGPDNTGLGQVFCLERDGKTHTQVPFEPVRIWDYAVSPVDGSIAYEANSQLALVRADGSSLSPDWLRGVVSRKAGS